EGRIELPGLVLEGAQTADRACVGGIGAGDERLKALVELIETASLLRQRRRELLRRLVRAAAARGEGSQALVQCLDALALRPELGLELAGLFLDTGVAAPSRGVRALHTGRQLRQPLLERVEMLTAIGKRGIEPVCCLLRPRCPCRELG